MREVVVAKNYLDEKEFCAMGQLVFWYLDVAEHLDCILTMNGEQLLQENGILLSEINEFFTFIQVCMI